MDDPHPVLPMMLLLKIILNECKKGDRTKNNKDVIKETVLIKIGFHKGLHILERFNIFSVGRLSKVNL